MRKEVKKIIDGQEYTFYALPATQSFSTLGKIAKLLCSTLGAGLDSGDNPLSSLKDFFGKNFDPSKALQSLATRLNEDEVLEIALLFFAQTTHKGDGRLNSVESVDLHFGGQILHMIKVFSAALNIEYADFFAEGQGLESIISRAKENLTPAP